MKGLGFFLNSSVLPKRGTIIWRCSFADGIMHMAEESFHEAGPLDVSNRSELFSSNEPSYEIDKQ